VDGIKTGFTNASGYNLMASAERGGRRVIAIMLGGSTGRSRDQHVADLLEAAFMEISGVPAGDDLRARIAFGDRGNASADDLALAQLRKLTDADAALVSANDPELVAELTDEIGSTEESEDAFEEVAEGDGEAADQADDPIGALIEASPATTQLGSTPIVSTQTVVPASEAILITSEVAAGSALTEQSLNQLSLPVTAQ
jgi:D-alanyl-D-alanine carboxypeptidase